MKDVLARSEDRKAITDSASAVGEFLPSVRIPEDLPQGPVAIADMANAFGVTHRTLHFYEEKKLLKAGRIGLMRVYGPREVHRMAVITLGREVGMPIAVIQDLMADLDACTSQEDADTLFMEALMVRKRELISGLSTVHRQMQQITHLLDQSGDDKGAGNDNDPESSLGEIEVQCLELMAEGLTPVRMARALGMDVRDAQALEAEIIRKFSANNRFQAVAKAVLLGVIS